MIYCLFDIDGTLLSSGGAGKAALEAAFVSEFQVELHTNVPYAGRTDRAIIRDLLGAHGVHESEANVARLIQSYLGRLPTTLREHNGRVLPGIVGLLDELQQRQGFAIGLLTGNVRAGARAKLGHFGLFERFGFGGFGDHHFDRDDVAREALAVIRAEHDAHVRPDQVWVIGDTPLDVQCARAIGAKVAAVATGLHSVEQLAAAKPDVVLPDLAEAGLLLRHWS